MSIQGKRILAVTSVYPRSASDRYGSFVQETVNRLQETGAKFSVFAPAYEGSKHQWLQGVRVYRFRYFWRSWENLTHGEGAPTKIQNPLYLLIAVFYIVAGTWQLFWLCRQEKPDVLHVHWPFPHGLMAWPSSKLLNIPMVFSFHGAELLLARKFSFVAQLLKWLLPQARRVTANSSFTQKLIEQLYTGTVTIIPYGLTLEAKPPIPRPKDAIPTLLFAGRLIERKGLTYLVQALPLILAQQPVELRIVGKGDLEDQLIAQCQALQLQKAVTFLGFVSNEELAHEYASCDIFVLPSIVDRKGDTEGLGIVMLEAFAHSKPVVACGVGGIVDVVEPGVSGLLVSPQDPEALAHAILSLLSDRQRADKMGRKGLEEVQARFSWSRIIPLWENVFLEALGKKSLINHDLSPSMPT